MTILSTLVNIVLVAATLAVIWYARDTVRESRKATEATRDVANAIRGLLAAAQATATSSAAAAAAARETVEAARAARKADERARVERRLRDIGELVERVYSKAAAEHGAQPLGGWRCVEQQFIGAALVGAGADLPKCHTLAGSSQAHSVMGAAVAARDEIAAQLRELHAAAESA